MAGLPWTMSRFSAFDSSAALEKLNDPVLKCVIPYHVFVQQIMTLVLQTPGFTRSDWRAWIGSVPAFAGFGDGRADAIFAFAHSEKLYHMLKDGVDYQELGHDDLDKHQPQRLTHYLVKRLESLGH